MSEENKAVDKQEQKNPPIKTWSEGQEFLCPLLLDYITDLCNYSLEEVYDDRTATAAIAHAIAELARFYIDTGKREDKELPEEKAETPKKKIPNEILERYPYAKWIEALDGITGLEWAKVQHCISQRFKSLSSDYEKKTALSVSDMDLNWYLF